MGPGSSDTCFFKILQNQSVTGKEYIRKESNMTNLDKKYEELDFTNDLIFKHVLSSDIELCKDLINRIDPDIDTEGIRFVETEHEIIVGVKDEKRVRFDIMARNDFSINELEMYAYKPKGYPESFPKTARYNAAMIDSQLTKNHLPADLPDVTVILLCTFDPLGKNEPVYHIRAKVDEYPDYEYNEGRRICILTNAGIEKAPENLKPITYLLSRSKEPMNDAFYQKIQAAVKEIKTDPDVRRAAMNQLERDEAIKEKGREEGREEGRKEGMIEGKNEGRREERQESILKMIQVLKGMNLPDDQILTTVTESYPENIETIRDMLNIR
jgi:predicted transposase/invertase (TIGR01784 family)